jgi:hypothetical protein
MHVRFFAGVKSWFFAALIIALALALAPYDSRAQGHAASRLVGKWILVSVYEEDSGGEDLDRWGSAPEGQFIANADGSFSFLMVGRNVIRLAGNNAEQACARLRPCRETMDRKVVGYTGTFSIKETGKLSLDVSDGLERGWTGTKISADVKWEDGQMHFVTASDPSPTGSFYAHLIWRKAQ